MKLLFLAALLALACRAEAADFQVDWPSASQTRAILKDAAALKDRRVAAQSAPAGKTLAQLYADAPGVMSLAPLEKAWTMVEPIEDQGLTIAGGLVTPTLDGRWGINGIALEEKARYHLEAGDVVFSFRERAYAAQTGDLMSAEKPDRVTAAGSYRCRLLPDPRLMICKVTLVPDHAVSEAVPTIERFEGFRRSDYSPFR